jgi:Tol biopolymer transport system component
VRVATKASLLPIALASALGVWSVGFASTSTMAPVAFPGGNGSIVTSTNLPNGTYYHLERWVRSGSGWVTQSLTSPSGHNDTSPSYSADGKRVVFVRDGDIWVVTNAGNTTRLTRTRTTDADPTYTPDGHIVWTIGKRLHEMGADGSHKVDLGFEGHDVSVSPNGRWVAYTRFDQQQAADHIFKAHLDGTHVTDLTRRATTNQQSPDWSPNGSHLVFQQFSSRSQHLRVAVMRADGSHVTILASDAQFDLTEPVYAPSGTKIAYKLGGHDHSGRRFGSVYILDLATKAQTPAFSGGGGYDIAQPTWQPT